MDNPSPPVKRRRRGRRSISARELAEFVYCAKSWDLSRRYGSPQDPEVQARLAAGRQGHAAEGAARQAAERAVRHGRLAWLWWLFAVLGILGLWLLRTGG